MSEETNPQTNWSSSTRRSPMGDRKWWDTVQAGATMVGIEDGIALFVKGNDRWVVDLWNDDVLPNRLACPECESADVSLPVDGSEQVCRSCDWTSWNECILDACGDKVESETEFAACGFHNRIIKRLLEATP